MRDVLVLFSVDKNCNIELCNLLFLYMLMLIEMFMHIIGSSTCNNVH